VPVAEAVVETAVEAVLEAAAALFRETVERRVTAAGQRRVLDHVDDITPACCWRYTSSVNLAPGLTRRLKPDVRNL